MRQEELLDILFSDKDLLVVNKPAGLVCHPTKTDAYSSLISRARLYLGQNSEPQLINRLDRETSGVTLLALNPQAARQLRRAWEQHKVRKEYAALVHGHLLMDNGVIDAPLGKDERSRVTIRDCVRPDGLPARTEFRVQNRFAFSGSLPPWPDGFVPPAISPEAPLKLSWLVVTPSTGRKHQIRIHLAHLGHPIVGDKLYGGDEDVYLALVEDRLSAAQRARLLLPYHALHAARLVVPWAGAEREFVAPLPATFNVFPTSDQVTNSTH